MERGKEAERERGREGERETWRDGDRQRERGKEGEREGGREGGRERGREQRRLVTLLHARRCANHAIHGRFNPVQPAESADHNLRTSKTIHTDVISGMCVR